MIKNNANIKTETQSYPFLLLIKKVKKRSRISRGNCQIHRKKQSLKILETISVSPTTSKRIMRKIIHKEILWMLYQ